MKKWKYLQEYRIKLRGMVEANTEEEASEKAREQESHTDLSVHAELWDEFIEEQNDPAT